MPVCLLACMQTVLAAHHCEQQFLDDDEAGDEEEDAMQEDGDGRTRSQRTPFLMYARLPFAEDVRTYNFENFGKRKQGFVTKEQEAAIDELIDSMDLTAVQVWVTCAYTFTADHTLRYMCRTKTATRLSYCVPRTRSTPRCKCCTSACTTARSTRHSLCRRCTRLFSSTTHFRGSFVRLCEEG